MTYRLTPPPKKKRKDNHLKDTSLKTWPLRRTLCPVCGRFARAKKKIGSEEVLKGDLVGPSLKVQKGFSIGSFFFGGGCVRFG